MSGIQGWAPTHWFLFEDWAEKGVTRRKTWGPALLVQQPFPKGLPIRAKTSIYPQPIEEAIEFLIRNESFRDKAPDAERRKKEEIDGNQASTVESHGPFHCNNRMSCFAGGPDCARDPS